MDSAVRPALVSQEGNFFAVALNGSRGKPAPETRQGPGQVRY